MRLDVQLIKNGLLEPEQSAKALEKGPAGRAPRLFGPHSAGPTALPGLSALALHARSAVRMIPKRHGIVR